MPVTSNDLLRDRIVRHQIELLRLGTGEQARLVSILDETEADIRRQLEKGYSTSLSEAKLQFLEDTIGRIRRAGITGMVDSFQDTMKDFVRHEADFAAQIIEDEMPVVLDLDTPDPATLTSLVENSRFLGKSLSEWGESMAASELDRINTQIRVGMAQGLGTDEVVRSILGSEEFKGADGITSTTRNQVDSLVRTAINQYSNAAREELARKNRDIIDEEVFVATLDSRTTLICASNDGKRFKIGEGPKPPLHFRCRSLRVQAIAGDLIGDRPLKPDAERDLLKQYADKQGWDTPPRSRDALPKGHKTKFDSFKRKRIREMVGRAPSPTTYEDFLRRQSNEFQEEVLGVEKAKLFRDGMKLDKFVDKNGRPYTLDELKARETAGAQKASAKAQKAKAKQQKAQAAHVEEFPWTPEKGRVADEYFGADKALAVGIERGLWTDEKGMRAVAEKMMVGYPEKARLDLKVLGNSGKDTITVRGSSSKWEATMRRTFASDPTVIVNGKMGTKVEHDLFEVAKKYQGLGGAKRMMRSSLETYLKMGITKIEVHANIDVGGYAWAKLGFKPVQASKVRASMLKKLSGKGAAKIASADLDRLKGILSSASDDDFMYLIATYKSAAGKALGKELLTGSDWHGMIDLTNPQVVSRLKDMLK